MSGFSRSRVQTPAPKAPARPSPVPSALSTAQAPGGQKKSGGFGSFLGGALDKGDKLTGAFSNGLKTLYGSPDSGSTLGAPGRWGAMGRAAKPLGGAFGLINGARDMFDDSKSTTEKTKSGLGMYSGAKDLLETKTGQRAAGKVGELGTRVAESGVGQKAGGIWNSIKGAASSVGDSIMNSKMAQGIAGSKFGQGAASLGKRAGGLLDRSAGWGASKLNQAADFGSGIASKVKGSKAYGMLDNVAGKMGKRFGGEALEQGGKGLAKVAGREGLEAGGKLAAKSGMKALGKAGARFVPGMNVAIAGLDAKHAYDVWSDPKSGWDKKLTSGVTALGSGLAATNIPIVSQIGAGVSTVSSLVEAAGGVKAVGKGAQWLGGKAMDGAKWAGGKIADGAQWAGGKAKEYGSKAWNGAKNLGKSAVSGAKNLGKSAWNGAKSLGKSALGGAKKAGGAIKSGAKSLWNGGKSLAKGAGKAVGNVASKVGSGIKKVFSGW